MSVDVCRERFLQALGQLRGQFPEDAVLIGSYKAVVTGEDDVVFGLLIGLVGPSAPVCADALGECVSGFLLVRRRVELFGGPVELRSPQSGRHSRYTPPSVRRCVGASVRPVVRSSGRPVVRQ